MAGRKRSRRHNSARGARRVLWAASIGLCVGAVATIRPLDAVVVAIVIGLFQLWRSVRSRIHAVSVLATVAGGTLAVAPMLVVNRLTTGAALRFGYDVMWGAGHRVGFHTDPHGATHTPLHALTYAATYISELNVYIAAWPFPAMLLIVAALLLARRVTRWDALVMGLFAAQVLAYAAYWGQGEFLGPRFLYTAAPAIIVLFGRGLVESADRIGAAGGRAIATFATVCALIAWATPAPFSVWGVASQARSARRTLRLDLAGAVRDRGIHNAVIFVREPIASRLTRRLWGLGLSHAGAAQVVETHDPCEVLASAVEAEMKGMPPAGARPNAAVDNANTSDALCAREAAMDQRVGLAAFGPALLLDQIDANGQISGDVIYVADLDEHNEVLRKRFGSRSWYRLGSKIDSDGRTIIVIADY